MNNELKLICKSCKEIYDPIATPTICKKCGKPLNIDISEDIELKFDIKLPGIYKYIPINLFRNNNVYSLGEGDTPLVKVTEKLFFKLEYLNPSGSFKDRGAAAAVKIAYDYGYKCVIEDSSGNAGASISLYSIVYGLEPHIFIPVDAPENKKKFIKILGANLHIVKNRGEAYKKAIEYAVKNNYYYIGHIINPYFNLGLESLGIELASQQKHIDNIIVPVGSGGLYLGIYNGLRRSLEKEYLDAMPKIHPIEVEGYIRLQEIHRKMDKSKLGDGLRVPGPPRKDEIINAVKSCGGIPLSISDDEIIESLKRLVKLGFIVEPTSATAYAGYTKLIEEGLIGKDEVSIIILTGSGLKMIGDLIRIISVD